MKDLEILLVLGGSVFFLYALSRKKKEVPPEPQLLEEAQKIWLRMQPYDDLIRRMGGLYWMDPNLIRAVIWKESSGDPNAVGDQGTSFGLMQVSLAAAKDAGYWPTSGEDLLRPAAGIEAGTAYLNHLRVIYDLGWEDTLAAYNWGIRNVLEAKRRGTAYPKVVRGYVTTVLAYWEVMRTMEIVA